MEGMMMIKIFVICAITATLWILSKSNPLSIFTDPILSISQIISLEGIILISISLILTTRLKFLEKMFGGLDKMYQIHRILGAVAFIFLINHPLLLAVRFTTEPRTALLYLLPGQNFSYNLGVFGLYLFIIGFIFTAIIRLPYHNWKIFHKLLGIAAIFGFVHTLTIGSDIGNFLPLKLWTIALMGLGGAGLFYTIFLYQKFGPKFLYSVEKIERYLDMINIWLSPQNNKMAFLPGQFLYVKFKNKTVGEELHPFSISSAPSEGNIRLSIKIAGDYTLKLPELKIGDRAILFGPYGSFGAQCKECSNRIWIGGGVGITPFLSILRQEYMSPSPFEAHLFYCCKSTDDGIFDNELKNLAMRASHVNYINWFSNEKGRISADKIAENLNDLLERKIFLCGPPPMMESLKKQFLKLGFPEKNIIYEQFNMI